MRDYFKNSKQRSWPLFFASSLAVIYILTYLVSGSIPSVDQIILFRGKNEAFWDLPSRIEIPFSIQSWFDIPLVFAISSMFVSYSKYLRNKRGRSMDDSLYQLALRFKLGLWIGLSFGLLFSVIPAPIVGLWFGVWLGLLIAFAASLFFESWSDIGSVIGAGVGFGLMFNISFGIRFWLGLNLVFATATAISYAALFSLIFISLVLLKISFCKFIDFTFSSEPIEINFFRRKKNS